MFYRKALKIWWCSYLSLCLISASIDSFWENIIGLLEITGGILLKNLFVITVVILITICLYKLHPFFRWSWLNLFRDKNEEKEIRMNVFLVPTNIRYFGFVFLAFLMFNLPRFAMIEEEWFREGVQNWNEGMVWSVLFGMAHCLVGVPIAAGLAITVSGLWFTHQYFIGGIELSALHHTGYNLIICLTLFLCFIIKHYIESEEKKKIEYAN